MCYTEQKTFFGFTSFNDFFSSLLGFKTPLLNITFGFFFTLTSFIADWVYDEPYAIYTLWILMFCDWGTGIVKSFKNKNFTSSRLFRMPLYFVATTFLIAISFHIAKYQFLFHLVPSFILGGFYSVYFVSLIENLGELELLPKRMVSALKSRFGFKRIIEKFDNQEGQ